MKMQAQLLAAASITSLPPAVDLTQDDGVEQAVARFAEGGGELL